MKKLFLILFSMTMIISFSRCSKDDSEGPQGEQGLQGDQGPQGDQGDPGTANVIYSDWIDPTWNHTAGLYIAEIEDSNITPDIISGGVVLVYKNSGITGSGDIFQAELLPYYDGSKSLTFKIRSYNDHVIEITAEGYSSEPGVTTKFRYIIIPGGKSARPESPLPDFEDYQAVCEFYGIKE